MNQRITQLLTVLDTHFKSTSSISDKERLFTRVIKLNEEVGELCEAVLSEEDSNQRKKQKGIDLDSELADVLICTLLIAQSRDQDILTLVENKLTTITHNL